jgi:hypothetical protein
LHAKGTTQRIRELTSGVFADTSFVNPNPTAPN